MAKVVLFEAGFNIVQKDGIGSGGAELQEKSGEGGRFVISLYVAMQLNSEFWQSEHNGSKIAWGKRIDTRFLQGAVGYQPRQDSRDPALALKRMGLRFLETLPIEKECRAVVAKRLMRSNPESEYVGEVILTGMREHGISLARLRELTGLDGFDLSRRLRDDPRQHVAVAEQNAQQLEMVCLEQTAPALSH